MKNLILLFAFVIIQAFLPFNAKSQMLISAGYFKSVETDWNKKELPKFFQSGYHDNFWNDNFFLGIEYSEKKLLLTADLTYFTNDLTLNTNKSDITYGSHGESYTAHYQKTSAHINYAYTGLNMGIYRVFFTESFYNLIIGGAMHFDFLSHENEYAHIDSRHSTYSGVGFDYENNQKIEYTNTIYAPVSYEPFDAMTLREMLISTGISVKNRFYIHSFFLELNLTMGFQASRRTRLNNVNSPAAGVIQDPYDRAQAFTAIGFRLGYKLPFKGSLHLTEID